MRLPIVILLSCVSFHTVVAQEFPLVGNALICLHPDAKVSFEIESIPHHYVLENGEFLGEIYKFHIDVIEGFRDWDIGWEKLGTEMHYKETKKQLVWSLSYIGAMGGFYEEYWLSKDTLKLTSYVGSYPPSDLTEEATRYCQIVKFKEADEILKKVSQ